MLEEIKKKIEAVEKEARDEFASASNGSQLEACRIKYLGKKGLLSEVMAGIGSVPAEDRPAFGLLVNALKNNLHDLRSARREAFLPRPADASADASADACKGIDATLPGRIVRAGGLHPVSLIQKEVLEIFSKLGFDVVDGREVETEYYNFDALNHPQNHPARNVKDTFYIASSKNDVLLRTHTSPIQVRVMEKVKPPVRIVAVGKCYRRDASDASHSPVFNQVEGLLVDKGINFSHLKGILSFFLARLFGSGRKVRFTPSFFPFTEPSAEAAISCSACGGKGCRICGNGYLEILGCGMVHPNVFDFVKYDSEKYTGFAFGVGLERLAMLKYGVEDIRMFCENDIRFLRQFA